MEQTTERIFYDSFKNIIKPNDVIAYIKYGTMYRGIVQSFTKGGNPRVKDLNRYGTISEYLTPVTNICHKIIDSNAIVKLK